MHCAVGPGLEDVVREIRTLRSCRTYSVRSASTGSMDAALWAGAMPATRPMAVAISSASKT